MRRSAPKRNSLRAKMLMHFARNPQAVLTRQELADLFGSPLKTVDKAINVLKADGHITRVIGRRNVASYMRTALLIDCKPKPEKPVRRWHDSNWEPPRPIVNSIFNLAATMGAGS